MFVKRAGLGWLVQELTPDMRSTSLQGLKFSVVPRHMGRCPLVKMQFA